MESGDLWLRPLITIEIRENFTLWRLRTFKTAIIWYVAKSIRLWTTGLMATVDVFRLVLWFESCCQLSWLKIPVFPSFMRTVPISSRHWPLKHLNTMLHSCHITLLKRFRKLLYYSLWIMKHSTIIFIFLHTTFASVKSQRILLNFKYIFLFLPFWKTNFYGDSESYLPTQAHYFVFYEMSVDEE